MKATAPPNTPNTTNRLQAILFINLMTFGATFTNISFKIANANGVTAIDYQIFRGAFICLFIIPFLCAYGKHPVRDVPDGRFPIVVARSLFATLNFIFYMWAMTLLPMYLAVILNNLSPFWASILGTLVNGDKFYAIEFVAIAICFSCVVGITFTQPAGDAEALTGKTYDSFWLGVVVSIVKSVLCALLGVTSRRAKDIHFSVLMTYNGLLGFSVPMLCMAVYYWT